MDLREHYKISRALAAQGMVLLKNEADTLPLLPGDRVGVVGWDSLALHSCGGGSGAVRSAYVRTLREGLTEKAADGKLQLWEDSFALAASDAALATETLELLGSRLDKAIVTFRRFSGEGRDRLLRPESDRLERNVYSGEAESAAADDYEEQVGYFCPSEREIAMLDAIEQSPIASVVLILNIASVVDLSFIARYSKIKAVLLVFLPGMECGSAIADVLCGDVNPSGRLVDTVAWRYEDYPSADSFNYDPAVTVYKEGIFVGYRYFETFAKEKVQYPFGYGLSYTTFAFENCGIREADGQLHVRVDVRNTGSRPGREVVQIYTAAPEGCLPKPAVELRGFAKTKLLAPGEAETVTVTFPVAAMASFDDTGVTGRKAAWVLEPGSYRVYAGKSVRELYDCGCWQQPELEVTQQLTLRFDGSDYVFPQLPQRQYDGPALSLYDVAEGKGSLEDFICQLSPRELVELTHGQPPAFPLGTGGVGNLFRRGVPNPQTADGPAGIRRSVDTTCFPCSTLIAAAWDPQLQYEMGSAMGAEGSATGVDILLAPAMNIHRNPLCGRNFEYFSEDPLISGATAAAIVNGLQSHGMCGTLKHFAANNCEFHRWINDSRVSERALREIYLKAFEIAIRESNPAFLMTSYNLVNGVHSSTNAQLLRGVLRDEWHYEGALFTDWRNKLPLVDEILAGNNIKMPFGYPEEAEMALQAYLDGRIPLEILRENAQRVLTAVMKTRSFAQRDFGHTCAVGSGTTRIPVLHANGISSTRILQDRRSDGSWYMYRLGKDIRSQRTFIYFDLDVETAGSYRVSAEIATNFPGFEIWYQDEYGNRLASASCGCATEEDRWYFVDTELALEAGRQRLTLLFADEPDKEYPYTHDLLDPQPEDIRLAQLVFTKL